jgi:hypothetical protein
MTLPVDVGMTAKDISPLVAFDLDDAFDHMAPPKEPCVYAQIAERRAQLEDAETLRRVRAL